MPKLLDQVREVIQMKHYSIRTEQAYVDWINPVSESWANKSERRALSRGQAL